MVDDKLKNLKNSETAVSEVLGFILTLSIILLASSIVFVWGSPMLQKSMKNTHFQEMEESFMVLGQNINEVAYEHASIRNTELKILQGQLSIQHDSYMRIIVNETTYSYSMGSIEYYLDDKIIAFENGAICTKYPNSISVLKSRPHISYYDNITTIPVVELMGLYSLSGEGNARIRAKYSDTSSVYHINATGHESTIIITSSFYRGWEEYLEDYLGAEDIIVDDASQTVSANLTSPYIYVDFNRLDMEIF